MSLICCRPKNRELTLTWTIERFSEMMNYRWLKHVIETQQLVIWFPGQTEPARIKIKCFTNAGRNRKGCAVVWVEIGGDVYPLPRVAIGQLDKDGTVVPWIEEDRQRSRSFHNAGTMTQEGFISHAELTANEEQLLPDGRLIIHVKFTVNLDSPALISTTIQSGPQRPREQTEDQRSTENIY
jgi:hypothetical protein